MLITSLLIAMSHCFNVQASQPKLLNDTPAAVRLKATLTKLDIEKEKKQKEARNLSRTMKTIAQKSSFIKKELLIERCNALTAISHMIVRFLTPCSIPAWQSRAGEDFTRKGCVECASHPNQSFMAVTSQGRVQRHSNHYQTPAQGTVQCYNTQRLESEPPLQCKKMVELQAMYDTHNGPLLVKKSSKKAVTLSETHLYNEPSLKQFSLKLGTHYISNKRDVSWYQQCFNPQAKTDTSKKHSCTRHFIIAITPSSLELSISENTNELFIWSLPHGKLQSHLCIPSSLKLCTYQQKKDPREKPVYRTVGIDGFLWWVHETNGTLARLDNRGIWENFPRVMDTNPVWRDISPNAQWLLERFQTNGHETAFRKTSLEDSTLEFPTSSCSPKNVLWHVTTALWLNTIFKNHNQEPSTIHMEPRWILRYRNLKTWLAEKNILLAKGLRARIHADLQHSLIMKISKKPLRKGKKRKQR